MITKKTAFIPTIVLLGIFILTVLLFNRAFTVFIFADDFYHFSISRASDLSTLLKFFVPTENGAFYRPIPTQIFYYLISLLGKNLIIARTIIFGFFFVGLIFIYRSVVFFVKSEKIALLTIFTYATNFTHVYQLYWLSTFQEVAQFTFLSIATWLFLQKRPFFMTFTYFLAILSKEQSFLFPIFLVGIQIITHLFSWKDFLRLLSLVILISLPIIIIDRMAMLSVQGLPEYHFQINPRLVFNNLFWYGAWTLGLPSFLPDVIPSIFSLPKKELFIILDNFQVKIFFLSLFLYLTAFFCNILLLIQNKKSRPDLLKIVTFCIVGFLLSILPILGIFHKWMVRLTIPSLFFALAYASVFAIAWKLNRFTRGVAILGIILYFFAQLIGIKIHENESGYFYESTITRNAQVLFLTNKRKIQDLKKITFVDRYKRPVTGWEGTEKLKISLSQKNFIGYFFNHPIEVQYGLENSRSPGFVIFADQIIP